MHKQTLPGTLVMLALALGCPAVGYALGSWGGFWLGAAALLLLLVAASVFFLFFALYRRHGLLANVGPASGSRAKQDADTAAFIREKEALLAPIGWEDVYITSRDGLRLHGYYIAGRPGEARTVLLAHGYSVRALQMADYALYWRQTHGFNVLMPDARAHGQSEGRWAGMGWPERLDCLDWFAFLLRRLGPDAQFIMHGISMGGATTLTTGGEGPPAQLKFLVEDCGFTSAYAEFAHQLRSRFHLPALPLLPVVSGLCRLVAGYSFRQASARKMAGRITLPILFIHGEADHFVPTYMVHQLYDAATRCPHKECITVPGAGHVKSFFSDESGRIREALARYTAAYVSDVPPLPVDAPASAAGGPVDNSCAPGYN